MLWPEAVVASVLFVTGSTVLITVLWLLFQTWRAKAADRVQLVHDQAYRELAERATVAQQQTAADLAELRARMPRPA